MSASSAARWYMTYRGMSEQEAFAAVAADLAAERKEGGIEGGASLRRSEGEPVGRGCRDESSGNGDAISQPSDLDPHFCTADCCASDDEEAAA